MFSSFFIESFIVNCTVKDENSNPDVVVLFAVVTTTPHSLTMAAAKNYSWTTPCLIAVIAIQWVLFTTLLQHAEENSTAATTSSAAAAAAAARATVAIESALKSGSTVDVHGAEGRRKQTEADDAAADAVTRLTRSSAEISGVAATIIFRAPKWFFLRYKVMLDNALANLPNSSWKVQVFINEPWVQDQLLPWHPGLARMFQQHPRVIVTPLPSNLTSGKPRAVVVSSWFWENMAADRVLLFSGNGAICGNHQPATAWDDLLHLDYVGSPWAEHGGRGGDGSTHSLRSRPAMLRVLAHAEHQAAGPEHRFFLETMLRMNSAALVDNNNNNNNNPFQIATPDQTVVFGGVHNLSSPTTGLVRLPLTVAGTQAQLSYAERDSLLKHCPELKVIFPSLHDPACFGAHPDPAKCKATICALQDNVPSHGC